jgi:hypothetical protein
VGAVLEPVAIPGLSLTADYYDIRIKDAIVYNTTSVIVAQCFARAMPTMPTARRSIAAR